MAIIGQSALSLADIANRTKNGVVQQIVEALNQVNEVVPDSLWVECNDGSSHVTTVRTGLPQATWRRYNQGVPTAKTNTAQIEESTGMMAAYSDVDKKLADRHGNAAAYRASEDTGFVEGLSQQYAETFFYGSIAATPESFMGLSARYPSVSTATAETAINVLDGGGTGSTNTSMWLVVWGDASIHGLYPEGSPAGLQQRDLGEWTKQDANGNNYQVYRSLFEWDCGIAVRDWRYAVRICNIDVNALSGSTPADLITLMTRAVEHIPIMGLGRPAFYCNRAVRTWLRVQATNRKNMFLTLEEFAGKRIPAFDGIPIRLVDQLLSTEARVV